MRGAWLHSHTQHRAATLAAGDAQGNGQDGHPGAGARPGALHVRAPARPKQEHGDDRRFLKTEVVKVYKRINIVEVKFKGWVWEVPFCLVDPPTIVVSGKRTTNSVYKR